MPYRDQDHRRRSEFQFPTICLGYDPPAAIAITVLAFRQSGMPDDPPLR